MWGAFAYVGADLHLRSGCRSHSLTDCPARSGSVSDLCGRRCSIWSGALARSSGDLRRLLVGWPT